MRSTAPLIALLLAPLAASTGLAEAKPNPPQRVNIIVILADDLGYADLGCQGSKEVISPHIDSIAANGVRLTAGYVSAPQCCPSRAGLITGRYQNRFGFEANWPASVSSWAGLPAGERTIADHLKAAGYVTGIVGKWHLGDSEAQRPYNRGFDETFWHPNGGVLFPDKKTGFLNNLRRGPDLVEVKEYSTDAFGREAAAFIERHQRERFFLYLAFVPPHWPMQAKPEHLAQFAHVRDLHRRTMLAMMASLDENVGRVLAKLRETKLEEKTLVFFLSDNGGPTGKARPQPDADFEYGQNTSKNDPCRGVKGELLEGGIRIPFLIQWKGRIPAGKTFDQPVISLDILPTALAAAGVDSSHLAPRDEPPSDDLTRSVRTTLDGTNLLPFLTGEKQGSPHDTLYWRFRFPPAQPALHRWAIRQGDWKLVKNNRESVALYNLASDIGETNNLAAAQPERVAAMKAAWRRWDAQNKEPLWTDAKPAVPPAPRAKAEVQAAAYYFPNWHRAPGQTGPNFGEWGNLPRATPRFPGHQQPKHPVWGIQDEADPQVMAQKIAAAADHGLSAFIFCWYYHEQGAYLDRAVNEGYLKAPNKARLPFALMWANHDVGTKPFRKGAVNREIFDRMSDLLITRYFKDPAYWRVNGRCYFSIYQPMTFIAGMGGPEPARAALDALRDKARKAGLGELHLNLIDFELAKQPDALKPVRQLGGDSVTSYVWIHDPSAYRELKFPHSDFDPVCRAYFASWDKHWAACGTPHFPNLTMGWDPTPRLRPDQPHTGKGYPDTPVITGNTPDRFRAALLEAKTRAERLPAGQRVVTIYAWNEWSEGGYLEPEASTGLKYLEAIREVFGVAKGK
jgi:arylsulfatase A-like enzyme